MDDSLFESPQDFDFHNLPSDIFCVNVGDHISNFSSVEFSINFSVDEVKDIADYLNKKSIIDLKLGYHQSKSNLIYFRRSSKGRIFLDVRDHRYSYSVETDIKIDEELLHIPVRVKVREFVHVLKMCSESSRSIVIEGKGFANDQNSFVKMIDDADFARFEYFMPYVRRNYY